MTTYDPTPTVTLAGVDYTSDTIDSVRVFTGRTTIDDQPRAGYANISLIITDGTYPTIDLNAVVHIDLKLSNNTMKHVFTGYITDIGRTIDAYGAKGSSTRIDITAVGPLARLTRYPTDASYAKADDGDRIFDILSTSLALAWNEVSASTTWNDLPATADWDTYATGIVGTIAQPGTYELTAYSDGIVDAYSLATEAANSALGVLYENADGIINYDDLTTRISRPINDGYLELDAGYIQAIGTASRASSGNIINKMTIQYKNNATADDEDPTSQAKYGLFAAYRGTQLELQTDAEAQLSHFLGTRSLQRDYINTVSIPLHNQAMSGALRDSIIGLYCGSPLSIENLPYSIYTTRFQGFVEGLAWNITQHTATVTLTVSDYALSAITQEWQQVLSTETWQTISATLTWQEATVVA